MKRPQNVDLDQKYTQDTGRIFINGLQALVRLPMVQVRRDRQSGLNTAGFISGYRGSPLAGYDQQLLAASAHLDRHGVVFQPGVNEDLAATAVMGTQQLGNSPGARYDGVFGIWYGKGPGVDRCGDVFRHGNSAGTSQYGGVLAIAGDDHNAKSSTVPNQSDHAFISALMPVIYPSSVHEFIEMGLLGIAMSRYSGCWVGFKAITETVETSAEIDLAGEHRQIVLPTDFEMPADGLNWRWPDDRWAQDERLQNYKGYAAIAFARANRIDRVTFDSPNARFGIVASGKAYEDLRQALRELGIDDDTGRRIGLRLYKVGMPWPLEPEGMRQFCVGLEEVLVIEERREIIENQIKQLLFNWRTDVRPRVVGKMDHKDRHYLSLSAELSIGTIARAVADRMLRFDLDSETAAMLRGKVAWFDARDAIVRAAASPMRRIAHFCSGCPHNTSTRVPEGSRALAGIGCHFMATWMNRNTEMVVQMGGEGANWIGTAPFTEEKHIFANLGDGTYFHSGMLAIRQAVASSANITYKILFNDAVAMTGGQQIDGTLTPQQITHQVYQEGVRVIHLLSDDPDAFASDDLAPGTIIAHRDRLNETMRMLRDTKGTSVIVYVQTCAAEKRRRRKRGTLVDPPLRVAINAAVCEGCGDCSVQSNCISVEPRETPFGRKRRINQSSCNKDFSCLRGFCPSFVTIEGGELAKRSAMELPPLETVPPAPAPRPIVEPVNIALAGVGGTGVLTIGALIGMAAHIEGKASLILDVSGLAQKGGAVLSHIRIGNAPQDVTSSRIVTGKADLLIAADEVVAVAPDTLSLCAPDRTHAIVNGHLIPTSDFVRDRDFDFQKRRVRQLLSAALHPDAVWLDFTEIAEAALGDAIASNIMMLGYASQKGLLPVGVEALEQAITLNGVAVKMNQRAFALGRLAAANPASVAALMEIQGSGPVSLDTKTLDAMTVQEIIESRVAHLTNYQSQSLADRYQRLVERVRDVTDRNDLGEAMTRNVAIHYAKVLAYKDEYEVARLLTDPAFTRDLAAQFTGSYRVSYHLAPPFMPGIDGQGRPKKRRFGPWARPLFSVLAALRRIRGTPLDVFGMTTERRAERQLIVDYERDVQDALRAVTQHPAKARCAAALLALPDQVRGYGPVKEAAMKETALVRARLRTELFSAAPADDIPPPAPAVAAE